MKKAATAKKRLPPAKNVTSYPDQGWQEIQDLDITMIEKRRNAGVFFILQVEFLLRLKPWKSVNRVVVSFG